MSRAVELSIGGTESMSRAAALLAGIPGGTRKAMGNAARAAASVLRKGSAAAVRARDAISAGHNRDTARDPENAQVRVRSMAGGGSEVVVRFTGKRIPLYRFDGTTPRIPTWQDGRRVPVLIAGAWRLARPGVAASARVLRKNAPKRLLTAFTAEMQSGHRGIFIRTHGRNRAGGEEIRELYGPSVPQMLGHETVSASLMEKAMAAFDAEAERSILEILSGYGR